MCTFSAKVRKVFVLSPFYGNIWKHFSGWRFTILNFPTCAKGEGRAERSRTNGFSALSLQIYGAVVDKQRRRGLTWEWRRLYIYSFGYRTPCPELPMLVDILLGCLRRGNTISLVEILTSRRNCLGKLVMLFQCKIVYFYLFFVKKFSLLKIEMKRYSVI